MQAIVIYGASGHARVVLDAMRRSGRYRPAAVIADGAPEGAKLGDMPVIGGRERLDALRQEGHSLGFIAVGDGRARHMLAGLMQEAGFALASIVHPGAIVAEDVSMGHGVFVAAGAIINPGSVIGDLVIINTRASIDHDANIGDVVHLSPGATLGGHVTVREGAWVGIGATVLDRRTIGEWSIVGGGAVVTRDVLPHTKVVGVPARYVGQAD